MATGSSEEKFDEEASRAEGAIVIKYAITLIGAAAIIWYFTRDIYLTFLSSTLISAAFGVLYFQFLKARYAEQKRREEDNLRGGRR